MKLFNLILLLFCFINSSSQSFLNGSFENNSFASCGINMGNATFNSQMMNTKAFAIQESVDVLNNGFCSYGSITTAENGNWFIGLDTFGGTSPNIISMELSGNLVSGNSYSISYYDACPFSFAIQKLEIGLSETENDFGMLIYTSDFPSIDNWTHRVFNFTAPNNGKYVTAKVKIGLSQRWVIIDNFSIQAALGIVQNQNNQEITLYPSYANQYINLSLKNEDSYSVEIIDILGKIVLKENIVNSKNLTVNISNLQPDIYMCRIKNGMEVFVKKFIKH